jgi:hypothetical protein
MRMVSFRWSEPGVMILVIQKSKSLLHVGTSLDYFTKGEKGLCITSLLVCGVD